MKSSMRGERRLWGIGRDDFAAGAGGECAPGLEGDLVACEADGAVHEHGVDAAGVVACGWEDALVYVSLVHVFAAGVEGARLDWGVRGEDVVIFGKMKTGKEPAFAAAGFVGLG